MNLGSNFKAIADTLKKPEAWVIRNWKRLLKDRGVSSEIAQNERELRGHVIKIIQKLESKLGLQKWQAYRPTEREAQSIMDISNTSSILNDISEESKDLSEESLSSEEEDSYDVNELNEGEKDIVKRYKRDLISIDRM